MVARRARPGQRHAAAGLRAGAIPTVAGYHWGIIDAAVDRLAGAGIEPILMLDGPPPLWASGNPSLGNPRYRPSAPAFGAFAAAAAQRYGDRVDHYILWNEPNLPLWIQPQANCGRKRCSPASADTYRAMVNAGYQAIHGVDPAATVLIGALAPAGGDLKSRNANTRPLTFLRALGCLDAKLRPVTTGGCRGFQPALADGFAYHPHSTRNPPDQPFATADNADLASLSRIEHLLDLMQRWGRIRGSTAPLGIWLDEYGFQTNPPDKLRGVSPGRQDLYLQQAAYLAWRDPRVQLLSQYLWVDEAVGGGKRYTGWQSGLHYADGRPKPALAHFAHPMWLDFASSTLWGQVRPGGVHAVQVQVRVAGAGTPWQPVADVTTGEDGHWSLRTTLIPYASYRYVADDGAVSDAMVAAQPPPPSIVGPTPEPGAGPVIDRRIASTRPGAAVPPSFAGMSIEYWAVPDYIGSRRQGQRDLRPPGPDPRGRRARPADAALRRQLDRRDVVEPGRGAAPGDDHHRRHARLARPAGQLGAGDPHAAGPRAEPRPRRRGQRREPRAGRGRDPAARQRPHLRDRQRAGPLRPADHLPRRGPSPGAGAEARRHL